MAPLSRAVVLRSAIGRLRAPPARAAFSSAAGAAGTEAPGREAVVAAAAVAVAGSGLGLWLMPPSLADSGEVADAAARQISVAAAGAGAGAGAVAVEEERREKRRFLLGGERPDLLLVHGLCVPL